MMTKVQGWISNVNRTRDGFVLECHWHSFCAIKGYYTVPLDDLRFFALDNFTAEEVPLESGGVTLEDIQPFARCEQCLDEKYLCSRCTA
jgi:hypothetical protein